MIKIPFISALISLACFIPCDAQLIPLDSLRKMILYESIESAENNPLEVYRLDLTKQKLKTFPDAIFHFPNLNELILDRNKIDSIPSELAQLDFLQILSLSGNEIEAIPTCVLELKNLKRLDMSNNFIGAIPNGIDALYLLESLVLWDNPIAEYPATLEDLTHLMVLDLLHNQISYDTQARIREMLPKTKVITSDPCACQDGE